jgi:DGQHR domain-containing protein
MATTVRVLALRCRQNGADIYQCVIPLRDFCQIQRKVEPFDSDLKELFFHEKIQVEEYLKQQGYQRSLEMNRVHNFRKYITSPHALSPTAILLNDRGGAVIFKEETSIGNIGFGYLEVNVGIPLYECDGQHRDAGYVEAIAFGLPEDFPILVNITTGLSKALEMKQFGTINDEQKGVKTNLLIDLMTLQDPKGQGENNQPIKPKEFRKIACNQAASRCNSSKSSPWFGVLRGTNEKRPTKKEIDANPSLISSRLLGLDSFRESLEPVYSHLQNYYGGLHDADQMGEKIANVVINFWSAIRQLMPAAFEDPTKFVLPKSTGCYTLHKVLPDLLRRMYLGRREWTTEEFVTMVKECNYFTNSDFWKSDTGEASVTAGKSAFDKLAKRIIDALQ